MHLLNITFDGAWTSAWTTRGKVFAKRKRCPHCDEVLLFSRNTVACFMTVSIENRIEK